MTQPVVLPEVTDTLHIWIGVLGKTLVQKGILQKSDIIDELNDLIKRLQTPNTPQSRGVVMEIQGMINTVNKW